MSRQKKVKKEDITHTQLATLIQNVAVKLETIDTKFTHLESKTNTLEQAIENLAISTAGGFGSVDGRFFELEEHLHTRINTLDERLSSKIDTLDLKINRAEERLGLQIQGIHNRLDYFSLNYTKNEDLENIDKRVSTIEHILKLPPKK